MYSQQPSRTAERAEGEVCVCGGGALQPPRPKMILTLKDREGRVPGTSSPACSESSRTLQTDELMPGENRNVFEEASLAA